MTTGRPQPRSSMVEHSLLAGLAVAALALAAPYAAAQHEPAAAGEPRPGGVAPSALDGAAAVQTAGYGDTRLPGTKPVAPPPSVALNVDLGAVPEVFSDPIDIETILKEDRDRAATSKVLRYGVHRDMFVDLALGAWYDVPNAGAIWAVDVVAFDAVGVRLHFSSFDLPAGAYITAYAPGGPPEKVWRYEGLGLLESGEFWTPTIFGERTRIEYFVPAAILDAGPAPAFAIDNMQHIYLDPLRASIVLNPANCDNVACDSPTWDNVAKACAGIGVVNSNSLYCSGTMLATTNADQTPYWMTANHCLSTQSDANSAEIYWLYQASTCGGSPPALSTVPQSAPCTFLSGGATPDYTLLMVEGTIPTGLFWAGWTSAAITNGTALTCISHPSGSHKKISKGVKAAAFGCGGSQHVGANWNTTGVGNNGTEPGSSGSGLFRDSDQAFFGQLTCGPSSCESPSDDDYGYLNSYFASVSSLLAAGSDDALEQNDACATPRVMTPGSSSNLIVKSTDEDWYSINVAGGASLTVTLTFTHSRGDIDCQLYNSCGGSVVASSTGNVNNESFTYVNSGSTQDFYLRVYLDADTRQTYSMTISTSCSAPGVPTGVSATDATACGSVTVSWTAVSGATGYQVWRNTTNNSGTATQVGTPASSPYPDNTVSSGITYYYWVKATNACGTSGFSGVDSGVTSVGPSISAHPSSQTVCSGTSVTFNVTAGGTAPLNYQWRRNGSNISGATNPGHTINPVNPTHAGNYDCVVTNACGSVTSNVAVLTVNVAPSITTHPLSQTVNVGDPASFSVVATGTAPLSYQWRKGGVNIGGATSSTYNIASAALGDAGVYDCVVTNSCGSADSNDANLTVNQPCVACDVNCDGSVNPFDINAFLALLQPSPPAGCSPCAGDADGNGTVNPFDINAFLACLTP